MKKLYLLSLALASFVNAQELIHRIELKKSASFDVVGLNVISVYQLSDGVAKVVQSGSRKTIEAADYDAGIDITTKKPQAALQDIVLQISQATGRPLGKFLNTTLERISPVTMLMAADADSVWFFVLTPRTEPDRYTLTCAYLIDQKNR